MKEKMSQMMDKLPELLNKLGNKLGVASAKIWEWAMLDVKVQIFQDIALMFIISLFFFLEYKLLKFIYRKELFDDYEITCIVGGIIGVCLSVVGIIAFISCVIELPSLFINPEWNAFQNIMIQLSQLK